MARSALAPPVVDAIPEIDQAAAQRRVISVLAGSQVLGGVGAATGAAVGALLAADLSSDAFSGLAASSSVIGTALIAIPVSRVMNERGRRPGLVLAYAIGIVGTMLIVAGAILRMLPVAILGLLATGGGYTAGLQARYAAVDLAAPARRGRSLAIVVWATTVGSVLGPNLAAPMGRLAEEVGIPHLAGPYVLTGIVFALAATLVGTLLRPDPLLTARRLQNRAEGRADDHAPRKASIRESISTIAASHTAVVGLTAMAIGQAVMVAVMSMTPVHLKHHGANLELIGLIISGHIAGMYVASPLVGIAADRLGRRPVILVGGAILLTSFLLAGTAGGDRSGQLGLGLFLLGLGWSCTLIAGSTLLTEAISLDWRANVQGAADLIMGMAGASAGLLAGVVVGLGSYPLLNLMTTLLVAPMILLTLRGARLASPAPA